MHLLAMSFKGKGSKISLHKVLNVCGFSERLNCRMNVRIATVQVIHGPVCGRRGEKEIEALHREHYGKVMAFILFSLCGRGILDISKATERYVGKGAAVGGNLFDVKSFAQSLLGRMSAHETS